MSENDELLQEFLVESYENLDRLDGEFVALEADPDATEILSSIFRTIHTIKGTCGFLELTRLEAVTHAGENLLTALRDGSLQLTDEITTALLQLVDAVREMLGHLEGTGTELDKQYPELIATLESLQANRPAPAGRPESPKESRTDDGELAPEGADRPGTPNETPATSAAEPSAQAPAEGEAKKPESALSGSNIRVQVDQLDKLMNLAGELVLARNQILQSAESSHDTSTLATAQRLNIITTELQERIMKVRMQPVGILWSKFPRIVRDLSKQLGKSIELQMKGKETELDKTLLEAIKDPLTHLVRNAVDHGVETPEKRLAAGKEETGALLLDAYHESGQVFLEIVDDGGGIDPEAVKAKAQSKGLISADEAAAMTDRQACNLIFHPGLSTAKSVTNVSGRGVGMDVVRTNIEKIGGSVEVMSTPGKGTTVSIKIPLTLAIIPALIVTTASDRYAVPQVSLVELVRLDGEAAKKGIEDLHGSPFYRLRGDLLPLLFLDQELSVTDDTKENASSRNIVVVRAGDQLFGLVVDEINDTEEIVVKPLDQQTKSIPVYAGTTILGDGQVALILDVLGLARRAGLVTEAGHERMLDTSDDEVGSTRTASYLLLGTGTETGQRLAIDLAHVDRLEEFPSRNIERSGSCEVVQYRGEIMPLVRVSIQLGLPDQDETSDGIQRVVVHSKNGQSVGLIVSSITDIVETRDAITRPSNSPGIESAVVIDGKVTDLLDLQSMVDGVQGTAGTEVVRTPSEGELPATRTRQFCTFFLDELFFGVEVTQVQEVMRHQPMTRVPLTTNVVSGIINLRGQTVTALDMRRRLDLPARDLGPEDDLPMNLVLRTRGGIVSILVDRIGDVLTVEDSLRAPVPNTVQREVRELLTDVYKLKGALLLPLDIEELVNVAAHEEQV